MLSHAFSIYTCYTEDRANFSMHGVHGMKYADISTWQKFLFEVRDRFVHRNNNFLCILNQAGLDPHKIRFISVGANDGVTCDPIAPYINLYHWEGIMIEPVPFIFKELESNYAKNKNIIIENVAIGNYTGVQAIYYISLKAPFLLKKIAKALGSFHLDTIKGHAWFLPNLMKYIETSSVPVLPLSSIIQKYNFNNANLLVIDTEGNDLEVLKGIDFNLFKPKVIFFETKHLSSNDKMIAKKILIQQDYKIYDLGRDSYGILT